MGTWAILTAICAAAAAGTAARTLRRGARPAPAARWRGLGAWLLVRFPAWRRWLETAIRRAGERDRSLAEEMAGLQVVALAVSLPATFVLPAFGWLLPLGAVALPVLRLRDRAKRRALALSRELPWALDLLTLAVEVGIDFNVAVARVAERCRPGPLRELFAELVNELKVGAGRQEALAAMRRRAHHPAIGRFCTAVIQADRLGTPLARVLRSQAADLRIARCQRAEQLAGEAPVKLLAPLLVCIFPTVFLVLLGPIAFSLLTGGGLP